MRGLLDLPPEILNEIFLYLYFLDIFSCKKTSRRLSEVISSSSRIIYHVELQIAGMRDNPQCSIPTTTRLDMLRKREEAWLSFRPRFSTSIEVPFQSSGLYDVTPGFYLSGKDEQPGSRLTRCVQAIRLPHERQEVAQWDSIDFGSYIVDFATSIEEDDLVAAVALTKLEGAPKSRLSVVLRRYSTQQPYDGVANNDIFLDEVSDGRGRPMLSIEIAGENLIVVPEFPMDVLARNPPPRLMYVVNWKTGKKKTDPVPVRNPGLVFLSEDVFLNPNTSSNAIDIFRIAENDVHLIQRLSFPALQPNRAISFIACRGDPSPTAGGAFPKHTPQWRPYANDPEEAIIVFAIQIGDVADFPIDVGADHFFMIVHRRALLSLLRTDDIVEAVPWESWGPPITRWIPTDSWAMNFITLSAGQRFVFLDPISDDDDDASDQSADEVAPRNVFTLLDFNPWNVRRVHHSTNPDVGLSGTRTVVGLKPSVISSSVGGGEDSSTAELPENICPRGDAFLNDVVGRLPFIRQSHISGFNNIQHNSVLIDEERLIGLQLHETDSLDVMYFG